VVQAAWPADKVERRDVDLLVFNPKNARVHSSEQIDQIAKLITEFGWTTPCLVDEDDLVLAGHGRVMAAHRLGLKSVPVVVLRGLSGARKRALMIADNKVPENAEWNTPLLRDELLALREEGVDLSLIGFDDQALVTFLAGSGNGEAATPLIEKIPAPKFCCPKCKFEWSDA